MVLPAFRSPLERRDLPVPKPGPTEALVRVRAAGVGLTIVAMIGVPGRVTSFPRVPGHELAGEVADVGSEVQTVAPGNRVTGHFYLTCGACAYCRSARETLCVDFKGYVGMACDGAYAEYVTLPARNLVRIPDGVSDVDAAVAADAIATPLHACREEARIGPGDRVLVVGAGGGVGIHMVQMAKLCGGYVIAADIGDAKLEMARSVGADAIVDVRHDGLTRPVLAATDGRGVDAAIDVVATRATLEGSLASLARAGRLVIIGSRPREVFGDETTFSVDPQLMLSRMLEIHGSRYVTLAEIGQTLELLRQRRIRPIVSATFPLEAAEEAHEAIRQNALVGRAALVID